MEIQIKQTTDYPYDLLLLADPSREFVDNYLKVLDRDYFVRNYPEPIWENGVQCRHRLILEKELGI